MAELQLTLASQCRKMNICNTDIIGNPETGTIIGLNEEGSRLLQKIQQGEKINISSLSESEGFLLGKLYEKGFFDHLGNEHHAIGTYLHITNKCNLKCSGCYSYEDSRNCEHDLTLDELKHILDNLVNAGLSHLVLSGGEPFVRRDLDEFLAYARSSNQIESIECITNGTAPLEQYRKAIKYLDKLTFSLDSPDEKSAVIRPAGVFEVIRNNIIQLKEERERLSIVFTIHHSNVTFCDEMMRFAKELNVDYRFSILTVDPLNKNASAIALTAEDYKIFHNFVVKHQGNFAVEDSNIGNKLGCVVSCGAGQTTVSIGSDGMIYPCHMFVGKKHFSMGNAIKDDIKDILVKNDWVKKTNVDVIDKCRGCNVRYICGGGCRFRAYAVNGDIYSLDPLCQTYLSNIEANIRGLLHNHR